MIDELRVLLPARLLQNYLHMKTWIVLILIMSGCSSASVAPTTEDNNNPSWISKPDLAYPADRYLVSVGEGSNRERAIEDAKKAMAESFIVKVQSITESKSNSTLNQDTTGAASSEAKQDIQKNISLRTDTYLRGAEVKETANQGSTFYALVVLDKLKARSGLLLQANRIKADLSSALDSLEQKYTQAKYNTAKLKFAEFETLYGEASALGMSALVETSALEARMNRVETIVRNKNSKLPFTVSTTKGETYFERDIESCINDRGGVLFDKNDKANRVQIEVVERPQHLPIEGWQRIRFDLTAAIVQADGKKYRIQTTQTETARTRDAVMEAVSDKLSEDLCNQLFNRISEMNN